jgi:hypothetical protein
MIERMEGVSTVGNPVWDGRCIALPWPLDIITRFESSTSDLRLAASSRISKPFNSDISFGGDILPPFSCLTTDIEREMKSECYSPGTFHVVLNPDSFKCLPEYADDESGSSRGVSEIDRIAATGPASVGPTTLTRTQDACAGSDDPNVVILSRFEELLTVLTYWNPASRCSPSGNTIDSVSSTDLDDDHSSREYSALISPTPADCLSIQHQTEDSRLLQHFHAVIWKYLAQTDLDLLQPAVRDALSVGGDIFERQASTFRPVSQLRLILSAF